MYLVYSTQMVANGSSVTIEAISDPGVLLEGATPVWDAPAGYLDTANYGLPPVVVVDAVSEAIEAWRTGGSRLEDWIDYCERARLGFAQLVGVAAGDVACASNTSQLVGVAASSLPPGAEVLIPQEEFTSNVFPWLIQEARGIRVKVVPASELAAGIRPSTTLVAFSLVQSATGYVADLDAIQGAADAFGSQILVDATQACGWISIDARRIDYLVCSAYKWLMAPRGTAFMMVRPDRLEGLSATAAGWFAGHDVLSSL
jgi:selenocysteine lyase/cysteine desulfurase